MPLDLRGFMGEPEQWGGLYHAADQLEKRRLRADQLALQRESKRAAAGTFLQNYLDPKDYLTGTNLDPLILQGIEEAKMQGAQLASSGMDSPMLMVALGPMVSRINRYSTNAKAINKQVDDYIGKMKESGEIGFDFAKLKDEALRSAFYKSNAQGQLQLDPDQADPSVNWTEKAIELSPEKVTNTVGWDTFADKAKMKTETRGITDYSRFGNMDKHLVNLKFQEYMQPEWEDGKVKGFVPKYQTALDGGQPIMHTFTDDSGKQVKAAARLLDKDIYEGLPKGLRANIRGQAKLHINEYEAATGEKIPLNSPRAKYVEQALAYNELNRPQRNYGNKGDIIVDNKPSPQMISLNVKSTDQFKKNVYDEAAARKAGGYSVIDPNDPYKYRRNVGEVFADIFTGKENLGSYSKEKIIDGKIFSLGGGSRTIPAEGIQVVDVTPSMPDGVLNAGKGSLYDYKRIFFRPEDKTLFIQREETLPSGKKHTSYLEVPESAVGSFMDRIAEPNKLDRAGVPALLEKLSYKGGRFGGSAAPTLEDDVNKRTKGKPSWRKAYNQSVFNMLGKPQSNQ